MQELGDNGASKEVALENWGFSKHGWAVSHRRFSWRALVFRLLRRRTKSSLRPRPLQAGARQSLVTIFLSSCTGSGALFNEAQRAKLHLRFGASEHTDWRAASLKFVPLDAKRRPIAIELFHASLSNAAALRHSEHSVRARHNSAWRPACANGCQHRVSAAVAVAGGRT